MDAYLRDRIFWTIVYMVRGHGWKYLEHGTYEMLEVFTTIV